MSRYAQVIGGVVANVVMWDGVGDWAMDGAVVLLDDGSPVCAGWLYSRGDFSAPEVDSPTPTQDEIELRLKGSIQSLLDRTAQAYGYDNIAAASTYADEDAVAKFQAEGRALRAWRSTVWQTAYAYLADVQAGVKPSPSDDELATLIPAFVPPADDTEVANAR